jgi:hypothetical protein
MEPVEGEPLLKTTAFLTFRMHQRTTTTPVRHTWSPIAEGRWSSQKENGPAGIASPSLTQAKAAVEEQMSTRLDNVAGGANVRGCASLEEEVGPRAEPVYAGEVGENLQLRVEAQRPCSTGGIVGRSSQRHHVVGLPRDEGGR